MAKSQENDAIVKVKLKEKAVTLRPVGPGANTIKLVTEMYYTHHLKAEISFFRKW